MKKAQTLYDLLVALGACEERAKRYWKYPVTTEGASTALKDAPRYDLEWVLDHLPNGIATKFLPEMKFLRNCRTNRHSLGVACAVRAVNLRSVLVAHARAALVAMKKEASQRTGTRRTRR